MYIDRVEIDKRFEGKKNMFFLYLFFNLIIYIVYMYILRLLILYIDK